MEQQHLKMSLEEHQKKEEDCFCGKIRCEAKKEKSNKSKSECTPQQPLTPAMANEPSFPFHHSLKEARMIPEETNLFYRKALSVQPFYGKIKIFLILSAAGI